MEEYLFFGMSGLSILIFMVGVGQLFSHKDQETPAAISNDPVLRGIALAEHNLRMTRAVGDQIVGAVLIVGGFLGGCLLWF